MVIISPRRATPVEPGDAGPGVGSNAPVRQPAGPMPPRRNTREAPAPIYEALIVEQGDVPGQVRDAAAVIEETQQEVLHFSGLAASDESHVVETDLR